MNTDNSSRINRRSKGYYKTSELSGTSQTDPTISTIVTTQRSKYGEHEDDFNLPPYPVIKKDVEFSTTVENKNKNVGRDRAGSEAWIRDSSDEEWPRRKQEN